MIEKALVYVVRAIEEAPADTDISSLLEFCEDRGLPGEIAECLVNMPGEATIGRLRQALTAIETPEGTRCFLEQYAPQIKAEEAPADEPPSEMSEPPSEMSEPPSEMSEPPEAPETPENEQDSAGDQDAEEGTQEDQSQDQAE